MVLTSRGVLAQCMRELIQIRLNVLKEELAFGGGVTSYESYRERVGVIRGLSESLDLLDAAEAKLDEDQRGK